MVSAALVTHLDVPPSYAVPWESEKLRVWYNSWPKVSNSLLKAKENLLAVAFLEPSYCSLSDHSPALGFTARSSSWENPARWRQLTVRAWNTWWFWVACCSVSLAVAYRELSATELEEQRRKSLVAAGPRSCRTLQVCCREAQQKFLCSERLMLFNLI